MIIESHPVELAYCLSLINTNDRQSIIPGWVHHNFPAVEQVIRQLRSTPCGKCGYCNSALNLKTHLKFYFNYDNFRSYDGEPLQEKAAQAAVENKSLIAVFPTGGGKSVTFQLPALIAGKACRGLTVVISPLQSLMADAVTINGMLDPIERAQAFENTCGKTIYRSDFDAFVYESKFEDFYSNDNSVVTVSTIHKSKGREFDNVYLLLNNYDLSSDEKKRALYVGITRAKKALHIHFNNDIFSEISIDSAVSLFDSTLYSEPEEIVLQLSLRDVILNDFKGKKPIVFTLQSGDTITLSGNALWTMYNGKLTKIAGLSKSCRNRISELKNKGYSGKKAKVRFIVDWHEKDTNISAAVVLTDLYFKKMRKA